MTVLESIPIALSCMSVVFAVLGMLWAILRVFSLIIRFIEKRNAPDSAKTNP